MARATKLLVGQVHEDADGYAHVLVEQDGSVDRWVFTPHEIERAQERAKKRVLIVAKPSALQRLLYRWGRTIHGILWGIVG